MHNNVVLYDETEQYPFTAPFRRMQAHLIHAVFFCGDCCAAYWGLPISLLMDERKGFLSIIIKISATEASFHLLFCVFFLPRRWLRTGEGPLAGAWTTDGVKRGVISQQITQNSYVYSGEMINAPLLSIANACFCALGCWGSPAWRKN